MQELVDRQGDLDIRKTLARGFASLVASGEHDSSKHTSLDDPAAQPLTVAEHLELLAVEESIRRRVMYSRALAIRDALEAGARWEQVAAAIGTDIETAKATFECWIIGQERLYDRSDDSIGVLIGLSPDDRRAARALLEER
jgi:hypothetical protein